jgi:heat shock protein HslJ
MLRSTVLLAFVALLPTLAACAETPTPVEPVALIGTKWMLETLRGQPLIDGLTITLEFDEQPSERLRGSSGCNNYGARYLATETTFSVADGVETTLMACETPAGVMEQEETYTSALMEVRTYRVVGDRLNMAEEEGDTVLVFTAQE